MFDVALKFAVSEFNSYLLARTGSEFGKAQPDKLVDDTGKWTLTQDRIGATLINIEEERALRDPVPETVFIAGRHVMLEPALKLNLCVLFAANFQQYEQALRQLSHVVAFFQAHPTFASDENPGLDPAIRRLSVDFLTLTYEQLNQVWAYIGGKYLPSVAYRMRMVLFQDAEPIGVQPPVTKIKGALKSE